MATKVNGVAGTKFTLKRGEAKNISFTYDVDITLAVFSLIVKDSAGLVIFEKADEDFNKVNIEDKIVIVNFSSENLDIVEGSYDIEIMAVWNSITSVDKSETLKMKIIESLFTVEEEGEEP